MKAFAIERYGPPEVLEYRDVPAPDLKPAHILIKVHATSVNPLDFKIRRGELRLLTGLRRPRIRILGFDVAGEVTETGDGLAAFQRGDQVYAFTGRAGGADAEYLALPEGHAAKKPAGLSFWEAAAVPLASLTALQALRDKGRISPGKEVLVN